jgi:hypothetical protein
MCPDFRLKDKILLFDTRKPFFILEQSLSRLSEEKQRFEPEKNGSIKGRNAPLHGDSHSELAQWDDVRTYGHGKQVDWQIPVQKILQHVVTCEKECPQLGMTLDKLFEIISEYQKQVA